MCGRFILAQQAKAQEAFDVKRLQWQDLVSYNVAPSRQVPVVRMAADHDGGEHEGVMMRWGLVPAATKPTEGGQDVPLGMPSVRSVAIESSDDYRTVWLYGQRCIVPLAGFYVWKRTGAGHRQPFYVRLVNRPVFGVAALWDRFVTDEDDVVEGLAIVTVPPNSLLAETGAQMPAILHRDSYDTWLSGRPAEAKDLLNSYPPERMLTHAVGPHVNFLEYDDPSLIRPIV